MTRAGKRRRSDGIFYQAWNDAWYSSVTGKKEPLRDEHGRKIHGKAAEMEAKIAYARLLLELGGMPAARKKVVTVSDVLEDYLAYLQRRLKDGQLSQDYFKVTRQGCQQFLEFVSPETPAKEITPSTLEHFVGSHPDWKTNTARIQDLCLPHPLGLPARRGANAEARPTFSRRRLCKSCGHKGLPPRAAARFWLQPHRRLRQ